MTQIKSALEDVHMASYIDECGLSIWCNKCGDFILHDQGFVGSLQKLYELVQRHISLTCEALPPRNNSGEISIGYE